MPTLGSKEERDTERVTKKQSRFVTKGNDLVQKSRYEMGVQQNKILLYLISMIKPDDTASTVYEISVDDFCRVCNIDASGGKNLRDAKAAIQGLADRSVWVKQPDGNDLLLRWLDRVELTAAHDLFRVTFHKDMLPYIFMLKERYTQYCLDNVLPMQSRYGLRLYEILKSYEGLGRDVSFTVTELRTLLSVKGYDRYPDFRRYVLEAALSDINTYSDISVAYTAEKTGQNHVTERITFSIRKPVGRDRTSRQVRKQRALTE